MRRMELHLQHLSPSKAERHQSRALNKGEDPKNRVRDPLARDQSQGKDPLDKDPGKDRDHQARGPNQVKVLLAKGHLGRAPGKVREYQVKDNQGSRPRSQVKFHQVQLPNKVVPHNKDQESQDQSSKDHLILGLREVLLLSRGVESLEVGSVRCVRPPN